MIHVCYMTNNGYCAPTVVSAVSVFESNRDVPVCVHVLTEEVSPENEQLLMSAAENYPNGTVRLHNCDTYIREIRENYRPHRVEGNLQCLSVHVYGGAVPGSRSNSVD